MPISVVGGQTVERAMVVDYDDITSKEATDFCLPNPSKTREDTLKLVQVEFNFKDKD